MIKNNVSEHTALSCSCSHRLCICLTFCAIFLSVEVARAEDWPTYMHDNARSGITTESLDLTTLARSWVYTSPTPPQVAWDGGQPWDAYKGYTVPSLRDFDFAFSVTVVGDCLYFGSSVTDSIHCLDVNTGQQKWFFRTNGPVRYPPCFYEGKLYFGSDDGYVYCIKAEDQSIIWKYSPSTQTRLIGNNGSLIPMWPIRTGTAVQDGKMYFAASLVPWKSSYLCSLDALTGSDNGAGLYKVSGGATPMSTILLSSSAIYLMQGRQGPVYFNRANGSSYGSYSSSRNAGCYAVLPSDSEFAWGHGGDHQSDYVLRDTQVYSDGKCMVVARGMTYVMYSTQLKALTRPAGSLQWSVSCDCPYTMILVDDVLFAGGTNHVKAFSVNDGSELWNAQVDGRVRGLAAANGHLLVSTETGSIHMFGRAFLPADLNRSGTVDIIDLYIFCDEFLTCTDPGQPNCTPPAQSARTGN